MMYQFIVSFILLKKEHVYNLDAYIADFLAEQKKLSAQGLGEFTIIDGQAANGAPMVSFVPNKAAYTTADLISYIAEHQGKNKIVTGFDVESHFNQIKQFINIGTPWVIPGFGQLKFGRNRELEFVQEVPNENALHERIRHKQAASEAHYQTYDAVNPATQRSNTGTILLTLVIVLGLGVGGYYFYANSNSATSATTAKDSIATLTDTVVSVPSSSNMNNTTTSTQPPQSNPAKQTDGTTVAVSPPLVSTATSATGFRFVLNRTVNAEYARKRYNQLKAYGTPVFIDSVKRDSFSLYKIYLRNNGSPADTAKLRDSLTRYYGKPVKVEVGQ